MFPFSRKFTYKRKEEGTNLAKKRKKFHPKSYQGLKGVEYKAPNYKGLKGVQ